MALEGFLVMIFLLAIPLTLLWLLAARYGADSRDGLDWQARSDWRQS